jgi:integral membrane sensor domain MASE1
VGDAAAIACLTPFCLVFVMPGLRRFVGLKQTLADLESESQGKSVHEAHGSSRTIESICFLTVMVGALWLVLGTHSADNHDMFYIFFLPIIWIAVRRGLKGASTGIFILDIGIVLSLKFSGGDQAHFAMLQFLMLILSLTGLVLGALMSERERTENCYPVKKSACDCYWGLLEKRFTAWTWMEMALSATPHFFAASDMQLLKLCWGEIYT